MLANSLARLSSGSKLVNVADDVGGAAVSQRLDAQLNRNAAAKNNVGNAISFAQTQDGFLQKVGKAFDRMSELSIMSAGITKSDPDRALYNKEFTNLSVFIASLGSKISPERTIETR